jgi:hypothetical protein
MSPRVLLLSAAVAAGLALSSLPAVSPDPPNDWGAIKGRVVFSGQVIPENPPVAVLKDRKHCLSQGPILKNEFVVHPKNKGVRWALVWLTEVDDRMSTRPIPIHDSLKKMDKTVQLKQSCCIFEPRVLGIREGQTLVIKNDSPIAHNAKLDGANPDFNQILPARGSVSCEGLKTRRSSLPIIGQCSIHHWMRCYIQVFKHPYFAVTDADGAFTIKNAPAGKYRLMAWQEAVGYVIINPKNLKDRGRVIFIAPNEVTDVGKIPCEAPRD